MSERSELTPCMYIYNYTFFLQGDILDRLTDSSKYTGSHKHRFDESGHGKGLQGRDTTAKGAGMSPGCVSSQAAYVGAYKGEGTYDKRK